MQPPILYYVHRVFVYKNAPVVILSKTIWDSLQYSLPEYAVSSMGNTYVLWKRQKEGFKGVNKKKENHIRSDVLSDII
jgi:hypothetical protein